jgi:hypothetical protein
MMPQIPVIEGYAADAGRADAARSPETTGRPRPRPRPRAGASQAGEDRPTARSTVYVSRHAAEPS